MCFIFSFIPATTFTVIGYFILFSSTKTEGAVQKFGQILAIWVFIVALMIPIIGALSLARWTLIIFGTSLKWLTGDGIPFGSSMNFSDCMTILDIFKTIIYYTRSVFLPCIFKKGTIKATLFLYSRNSSPNLAFKAISSIFPNRM